MNEPIIIPTPGQVHAGQSAQEQAYLRDALKLIAQAAADSDAHTFKVRLRLPSPNRTRTIVQQIERYTIQFDWSLRDYRTVEDGPNEQAWELHFAAA